MIYAFVTFFFYERDFLKLTLANLKLNFMNISYGKQALEKSNGWTEQSKIIPIKEAKLIKYKIVNKYLLVNVPAHNITKLKIIWELIQPYQQ